MSSNHHRIHPDVAWRLVDGVVFLLTSDSRYHQIDDPVGVTVWEALASAPPGRPADIDALAGRVSAAYDVDRGTAQTDLEEFLAELERVGATERVPSEGPGDPGDRP